MELINRAVNLSDIPEHMSQGCYHVPFALTRQWFRSSNINVSKKPKKFARGQTDWGCKSPHRLGQEIILIICNWSNINTLDLLKPVIIIKTRAGNLSSYIYKNHYRALETINSILISLVPDHLKTMFSVHIQCGTILKDVAKGKWETGVL